LTGGIANAGAVVRVGPHVLRPSGPHTASAHRLLSSLRATGFDGVPLPVGVDGDGRERLVFVDGDVPVPPYPAWAQADGALASVASLLRRFHDAAALVPSADLAGCTWSDELADPAGGGPVVCHDDVCLENVVFRDGVAVALLDVEFAAPGRPLYDLAQLARMCIPLDDDANAARLGWGAAVLARRADRLRLVADAYGLDAGQRAELADLLPVAVEAGRRFVERRVEAGDQAFVAMVAGLGGTEHALRRRRWFAEHDGELRLALA
jgi:hypothetical protein